MDVIINITNSLVVTTCRIAGRYGYFGGNTTSIFRIVGYFSSLVLATRKTVVGLKENE
jgi:hypothetical protein